MAAKIISGTEIAAQIREELKKEVSRDEGKAWGRARTGHHTGG